MNVLYLFWLNTLGNQVDFITNFIAIFSKIVLSLFGFDVTLQHAITMPKVGLFYNAKNIIAVSEGCNGVSVLITYLASMFSFNGSKLSKLFFIIVGLHVIIILNIIRVSILFYVSLYHHQWFSVLHEYVFTAIIYLATFGLFLYWVNNYGSFLFKQNEK